MADAETSSAALERYISDQLASLSLTVPPDDVELMARFVEEDLEREDKIEGVRGMLEGVVDGELPPDGIDESLNGIMDEWDRLKAADEAAEAAAAAAAESSPEPEIDHAAILASATEEELAAARKAALLRQYAYVEGGPEFQDRNDGAPPRGATAAEAEAKRKADERRRLIAEALRVDGMRKKNRKKHAVFDDPLEWQNLNKEKVHVATTLQREAAKASAMEKKNRDRLALEKQRADQAKAKADKQKKAQKQERRA